MPLFEDIYIDEADMIFQPLPPTRPDLNELAVILHSSGKYTVINDFILLTYEY
jgi:hypothetical protein